MRYRPFGNAGQAVSALTLSLGARDIAGGPEAGRELIYSALEAGINSYRLETADPVLAEVLGEALRHVDAAIRPERRVGLPRLGIERDEVRVVRAADQSSALPVAPVRGAARGRRGWPSRDGDDGYVGLSSPG